MKNRNNYLNYFFLLAICNLPFLILWEHNRLVTGLNPFLGSVFLLLMLLILFPVSIRVIRWTKTNWFKNILYEPPVLFSAGLISWNVICLLSWNSTVDFHFHDTYYIVSMFSAVLFGSFFFGIFCILSYFIPKLSGKLLNLNYSRIHFWISYWGLCYVFWYFRVGQTISLGEGFQPRRYVEYQGWAGYGYLRNADRNLLIVVLLMSVAQVLFFYNIIHSLLKDRLDKA